MSNLRSLPLPPCGRRGLGGILFCALSALVPAVTLAQASPEPASAGPPISSIDRLTRDRDTKKQFFSNTMVTLNLTYKSSGDLRSSLIKTEAHNLFMTVEVNGQQIKGIAKSKKPKVQEAVKAGPMNVKGRWARPGTRLETKCSGELTVGFQQIAFLPYGGKDGFSCYVEKRTLAEEVYEEWKAAFDPEQKGAHGNCATQHARGSTEFWSCIEGAGIPFPEA